MNFEEALKAVVRAAHNSSPFSKKGEYASQSNRFMYGTDYPASVEINDAARNVLKLPAFQGMDFEYAGGGEHGFIIGNNKLIVKIGESHQSYPDSIAPSDIPDGLAAHALPGGEGKCNGISYQLCERLNIERLPGIEELIPYLFKALEKGVVYWDPKPENFGRDEDGVLKAVDLAHFTRADAFPTHFSDAINSAIANSLSNQFSVQDSYAFTDSRYTYLLRGGEYEPTALPHPNSISDAAAKRLNHILAAVNVDPAQAEFIDNTPLVRIPVTQVTYGSPPEKHELAEYLNQALHNPLTDSLPQTDEIGYSRRRR